MLARKGETQQQCRMLKAHGKKEEILRHAKKAPKLRNHSFVYRDTCTARGEKENIAIKTMYKSSTIVRDLPSSHDFLISTTSSRGLLVG